MANIVLYNGSQRAAKTSKAFSCVVKKELMREYILSFGVINSDPVAKAVGESSILECEGQKFDLTGFKKSSGAENITAIDAQHVSYRLLDYVLPVDYAFVGTVAEIAADILSVSGASAEFTIGTCYDVGTKSFYLKNQNEVTAKYALIAMKGLGVEVDYDNFAINFPQSVGSGNSETFRFGVNMANVGITYQKDNGTTYEIDVANLQRIDGHVGDVFDVGDTVTIEDSTDGSTFTKRIITYEKHLDDPTQDKITLGVFIRDAADDSAAVQVAVDNSVQIGDPYNNVYISHKDGFVCETTIGGEAITVEVNATEGISVYRGTRKVFGVTSNGYCAVSRLFDPDDETRYIEMGAEDGYNSAVRFYARKYSGSSHRDYIYLEIVANPTVAWIRGTPSSGFDSDGTSAVYITHGKAYCNLSEALGIAEIGYGASSDTNKTRIRAKATAVEIEKNGTVVASW